MGHLDKRTPWVALVLLIAYGAGIKILSIVLSLPFYTDKVSQIEAKGFIGGKPSLMEVFWLSIPDIVNVTLALIFCLYVLSWFFRTGKELAKEQEVGYNAGLWMFLGLILGVPMIYVGYKTAKLAADYSETGSLFKNLLLLLFVPIGIFTIQRDINSRTAFEETKEEPSYGMLTRFGFMGMDYWWLFAAMVIYVAFAALLEMRPDLFSQLGLF
jgi:hypothetical protein